MVNLLLRTAYFLHKKLKYLPTKMVNQTWYDCILQQQYICIHQCLLCVLDGTEDEHIYDNVAPANVNIAFEGKEHFKLCMFCDHDRVVIYLGHILRKGTCWAYANNKAPDQTMKSHGSSVGTVFSS